MFSSLVGYLARQHVRDYSITRDILMSVRVRYQGAERLYDRVLQFLVLNTLEQPLHYGVTIVQRDTKLEPSLQSLAGL